MNKKMQVVLLLSTVLMTTEIMAQTTFRLGSGSTDSGNDIIVDNAGNTVLVGSFSDTVDFDPGISTHSLIAVGNTDNFIAKYDPNGNYVWAISFGGLGDNAPLSIKTDNVGNIYVCGYFSGDVDFDPGSGTMIRSSNGLKDAYIAKFNTDGNLLWVNTLGGGYDDKAYALRLDASNDIYMTGSFQGTMDIDPSPAVKNLTSNGGKDIFLLKYTPDGNLIWGFNIGGSGDDEGVAIISDSNSDCYLSGNFTQTVDFDPGAGITNFTSTGGVDIFLCKYLSDGTFQWAKAIGGKGSDAVATGGICLDAAQNIYITGNFSSTVIFEPGEPNGSKISNGGTDVFVAKYTPDGIFQMSFVFGGIGHDAGKRITVDLDGNIFVTGFFSGDVDFNPGTGVYQIHGNGTNGASDIFVAKYDFHGSFLWADGIGAVTSNPGDVSIGTAISLDGLGNCYVTGKFFRTADFDPSINTMNFTSAGSSDIFVLKLDNIGMLWTSLNYAITSVTPKSLNSGYTIVNSPKQTKFTVFNVGDVSLNITSITSTNSKFFTTPSSATILPLNSNEFTVSFTPTDTGYQAGYVIINHSGLSHRDTVNVVGYGVNNVTNYNISVTAGWNMISLPLAVGDGRRTTLFPTAITDAFAFIDGGYQYKDTLSTNSGYWLKFNSPQSIGISGQSQTADTINVINGWNMIGTISYPVSTTSIIQIPPDIIVSSFYEYSNSYTDAKTLMPGKAYWVKVNQNGKLILFAP